MKDDEINELANRLRNSGPNFNFSRAALEAFKFFHELSKLRVIDETYLEAVIKDAEV